jgi:hypothetical protein
MAAKTAARPIWDVYDVKQRDPKGQPLYSSVDQHISFFDIELFRVRGSPQIRSSVEWRL